jgi:uncharacterized membrane protein (DUF485 family)
MDKNRPTYSEVARSELFRKLIKKKKRFIVPMTLFFLAFYGTLPVLTAYSNVLNRDAIGSISWAWLFAADLHNPLRRMNLVLDGEDRFVMR